ncbi:MAG: YceD family protein [Streptosporangiaceae bacterium]
MGTDVKLDVLLEAMSDGVLVTVAAAAPVTGECARCLEPVASSVEVSFRELYEFEEDPADSESDDGDRRFLNGDLLDLEPALRDAMVLALPLAPLCGSDCEGLCPECGTRLADAGPSHDHEDAIDPRWARLRELTTDDPQDGARAEERQER